MAAHSIQTVQKIPVSLDKAWEFFINPVNLRAITPDHMDFQIISPHLPSGIYAGQIFEYRVRPVFRIPVYWMSVITQVKDRSYFIDEQRVGPYKLWLHQHHFKEIPGGVEMTDIIHYKNPLGFIGRLANRLFIRRKLDRIFRYRHRRLEELFGHWPG